MVNHELSEYARARKEQGASSFDVISELKGAGWTDADLIGLFDEPVTEMSDAPKPLQGSIQPATPETQDQTIQKLPVGEKIGKFKASWLVVKGSWGLLRKDKEMLWFPILSFAANLGILLLFSLGVLFFGFGGSLDAFLEWGEQDSPIPLGVYGLMLVLYIVSYFLVVFFEVGIVAIAHGRMQGLSPTFKDGIAEANSRIGKILLWALLSATVGIILRTIAERLKFVGKLVVWLLGATWNILTYFMIPIIYIENLSVKNSLKRSAKTIVSNWGEVAIVYIGVSAVFGLLGILGFVVFSVLVVAIIALDVHPALMFVPGALLLIYIVILAILSSTLSTIFKMALYEYATKRVVPEGFSENLLAQSFVEKKKRGEKK